MVDLLERFPLELSHREQHSRSCLRLRAFYQLPQSGQQSIPEAERSLCSWEPQGCRGVVVLLRSGPAQSWNQSSPDLMVPFLLWQHFCVRPDQVQTGIHHSWTPIQAQKHISSDGK